MNHAVKTEKLALCLSFVMLNEYTLQNTLYTTNICHDCKILTHTCTPTHSSYKAQKKIHLFTLGTNSGGT